MLLLLGATKPWTKVVSLTRKALIVCKLSTMTRLGRRTIQCVLACVILSSASRQRLHRFPFSLVADRWPTLDAIVPLEATKGLDRERGDTLSLNIDDFENALVQPHTPNDPARDFHRLRLADLERQLQLLGDEVPAPAPEV